MAHRKIVFVIVEGPADDEALAYLLGRIYDKNTVYVEIMHGDVTSEKGAHAGTIRARLGEILQRYMNSYHVTRAHFQEIVHIVDMDGAYIPDAAVTEDTTAERPIYSLTEIRTARVQDIVNRNRTKQSCLTTISSTPTINKIPYQAYYMSCNLDHVLYNKLNSPDKEKEIDSLNFARRYRSHVEEFVTFISESDFSIGGTYLESWDFIKQGNHSLERHTNFGICLKKALKDRVTT